MLCSVESSFRLLTERHYLGPTRRADFAWGDEFGVMVFATPRARNVPTEWIELVRWCLIGSRNGGSRQWRRFAEWARQNIPATTVISYSDPSVGHTGSLYRACNWLWAPTWLRLRPPPTGNGAWTADKKQAVKDRWIYPLRPDPARAGALIVNDDALRRRMGWAEYREPRWRGLHFDPRTGGGDFARFRLLSREG
jgi:hypothetical protein